ncbi:unnamed protein product [Mycena citricolor]|uniref:RNA polymerase II-associated protein 3 n=1 Tax=Mycena citricolor TaxID=2018698 RepID=A0AAD2HSU8_9AGAR|nr:unnamed protein product [Mycena citricolor]
MSAAGAQEKEKGNAAFKAGDFPAAIGHYSAAIHANRTDATFPLNRAAAYLKLGKNEDAERDCSTVLSLSKGNVKAFFRRAQARTAMGKLEEARDDLTEASKQEPENESVRQELKKVEQLLRDTASKSSASKAPIDITVPSAKGRRIPITIVEKDGTRKMLPVPGTQDHAAPPVTKPSSIVAPRATVAARPTQGNSDQDMVSAVSSRSLSGASASGPKQSSPPAASAPPPKPQAPPKPQPMYTTKTASSFKDAKATRDTSKPSRMIVGGGIFRASGESTVIPERVLIVPPTGEKKVPSSKPSTNTPEPSSSSVSRPPLATSKSPMTLFDFTRSWERDPDHAARYALLSEIPPSAIPSLFQTSLEPETFYEIAETLGQASIDQDVAKAYLHQLEQVPRFGTVARFLSAKERARIRDIWSSLGVGEKDQTRRPAELAEVWDFVYR